jgi:tRNA threonylcarbamoyladenosine biosynthesis protein TsaE
MQLILDSLRDLDQKAELFLQQTSPHRHFAFYGPMGVGKTTVIKSLCHALGASVTVTSPTFALVNEYPSREGMIYHFDFYRINQPNELFDIGAEEYFDGREFCFVEWPERAEVILPDDVVRVFLSERPDGSRVLDIQL